MTVYSTEQPYKNWYQLVSDPARIKGAGLQIQSSGHQFWRMVFLGSIQTRDWEKKKKKIARGFKSTLKL